MPLLYLLNFNEYNTFFVPFFIVACFHITWFVWNEGWKNEFHWQKCINLLPSIYIHRSKWVRFNLTDLNVWILKMKKHLQLKQGSPWVNFSKVPPPPRPPLPRHACTSFVSIIEWYMRFTYTHQTSRVREANCPPFAHSLWQQMRYRDNQLHRQSWQCPLHSPNNPTS